MEINKIKLAKARVMARKQIDGIQAAIKQVGRDILTARRDAWLDNEELKNKLEERLDDQHEIIEEIFERQKMLRAVTILQLVVDLSLWVIILLMILSLGAGR